MNKKLNIELTPIKKLPKYLKEPTSVNIDKNDIRFVIKFYYQMQDYRIQLAGQIRSMSQDTSDSITQHELLDWLYSNVVQLEEELKKAIDHYVSNHPVGQWLKQIIGIGPVLAGGLLCYLDVTKAPSVSHFYSYAGLNDNNVPWLGKEEARKLVNTYVSKDVTDEELYALAKATNRKFIQLINMSLNDKGKRDKEQLIKNLSKPPYNTELKTLCWKIGESFVKVSGKDKSLYGKIYKERKFFETEQNEALAYANQAEEKLKKYNIGKNTEAYKCYSQGKLPPDHVSSRAKRYAVKIFISHVFDEMYKHEYHKEPPRAYVFEHLGHVDRIEPEVPGIIL